MVGPTPADFRSLARSSPWLWRSIRFVYCERGWAHGDDDVRAWVRRPGRLRVERPSGELVQVTHDDGPRGWSAFLIASDSTAEAEPWSPPESVWWTDPRAPQPDWTSDGLVARRPSQWGDVSDGFLIAYDDPMYGNYRWVAMLDPVELADGDQASRPEGGGAAPAPIQIEALAERFVAGRLVWEAVVRPVSDYDPRCSCCPLLFSPESDDRESESGGGHIAPPRNGYPASHLVRLDRQTGICVFTEEIGGATAGRGHSLVIEEVDEEYPDDRFERPRPRRR